MALRAGRWRREGGGRQCTWFGNGETIVAELIFINEALEASPQKLDPPQRLPQSTLTLRKKAFS